MFRKIFLLIFVINAFSTFSKASAFSESNKGNLLLSSNNTLSELGSSQKYDKLATLFTAELLKLQNDGIKKDADIKILRANLETQKAEERGRQTKYDLENQSLRSKLERQENLTDEILKKLDRLNFRSYPHNCEGVMSKGVHEIILANFSKQPFEVVCDSETKGGGWTVILRRMDGSVNFFRNWTEYKNGFGNLDGEFFLGLEKIHALTADRKQELLVVLEDVKGIKAYEMYNDFAIGNENQQYELHTLGEASGTAGDSLSYHRGMKFTTFDQDNDNWPIKNCAEFHNAGWWYNYCVHSQLTGNYNNNTDLMGVNWRTFRGFEYSHPKAVMMIRPSK